ncbi:hypothetical protein NSQ26_07605 [Bacillus sp. FSL W7-1360]
MGNTKRITFIGGKLEADLPWPPKWFGEKVQTFESEQEAHDYAKSVVDVLKAIHGHPYFKYLMDRKQWHFPLSFDTILKTN